jgi:hypothetical protein
MSFGEIQHPAGDLRAYRYPVLADWEKIRANVRLRSPFAILSFSSQ